MKKIIVLAFLFLPFWASAQSECVFGLVNDPAPGQCGGYVDKDGNDLCDLSEIGVSDNQETANKNEKAQISEEELKQYSVRQVAEIYGISEKSYVQALADFLKISVNGTDSLQTLHDANGLCSGVAAAIAANLQGGQDAAEIDPDSLISGAEIKAKKIYEVAEIYQISAEALANAIAGDLGIKVKQSDSVQLLHDNYGLEANKVKELAAVLKQGAPADVPVEPEPLETISDARYKFIQITSVLLLLYLLSYILVWQKKLSILALRRIWNLLLLVAFLGSALLGLLLVIRINYSWYIDLPFNMLYWHVEFGTAMAIISLIHISWYWRFYVAIFKRKK